MGLKGTLASVLGFVLHFEDVNQTELDAGGFFKVIYCGLIFGLFIRFCIVKNSNAVADAFE